MAVKESKARGVKQTFTCEAPNCAVKFQARLIDRKRGWGRTCSRSCSGVLREIEKRDGKEHPQAKPSWGRQMDMHEAALEGSDLK